MIIVLSFPSIGLSEMKTVEGEYCDVYMGKMNDKKELDKRRKEVRNHSIINGIYKVTKSLSGGSFSDKCLDYVISNYLDKVVVVSHTECRPRFFRQPGAGYKWIAALFHTASCSSGRVLQ